VPVRVHGDQGAGFQMRAAGVQGADDHRANGYREGVLRWRRLSVCRVPTRGDASFAAHKPSPQERGDGRLRICATWDDARLANVGPVNAIKTRIGQELDPQRAQVHVYQESHAAGSGTSISSTRQAA
jgi:hypothetical protein